VRFRFIHEHREEFDLEIMLRVLEVSKGGYYEWQKRPESKRAAKRKQLSQKVKTIFENSRNTYGSARVHACLLEENESCCKPVVASIMHDLGLKGKRKGRVTQKTTNSKHAHPVAQNRLERAFDASKPDLKWASDITYLPTTEGWLYLAITLDLFSRKVVGWSMSESLESKLVLDALEMARNSRTPAAGLLHHSDRGVQYAALDFQRALARLEAVQSMSRKGDCWDNAVVESFFASLKCELDLEDAIGSRAETRAIIFEWIEVWYNRERRHSSLGFLSPVVFEERFHTLNCLSTKS
jgi:putative transposase